MFATITVNQININFPRSWHMEFHPINLPTLRATGKTVNVKKGQFLAPRDAVHAANKVRASGNEKVMLTERGTFFGYGRLVVDFAGVVEMRAAECPLIFDATHSGPAFNQIMAMTANSGEIEII